MEKSKETTEVNNSFINLKLTRKQLCCTNKKAKDIILRMKDDFEVNVESFKNFKMGEYKFIHFVFLDRKSLWKIGTSISDYKHDLYYLILINNFETISKDSFNNCKSYIVNAEHEIQNVEINYDQYQSLRKDFLRGVGNEIKYESTDKITEYITFEKWMFDLFAESLEGADGKMKVKVICINKECVEEGLIDNYINDYLRRPENQQRLSLAFQQTQESPDENYFDIGNMQP